MQNPFLLLHIELLLLDSAELWRVNSVFVSCWCRNASERLMLWEMLYKWINRIQYRYYYHDWHISVTAELIVFVTVSTDLYSTSSKEMHHRYSRHMSVLWLIQMFWSIQKESHVFCLWRFPGWHNGLIFKSFILTCPAWLSSRTCIY